MRAFAILLAMAFIVSCSNSSKNPFATSDSLVIRFNASQAAAEKIIGTTNRTAIKKLAGYMEGEAITEMNCDFDGMILFYSKGSLRDSAIFGYTKPCRFLHHIDINAQPVKMSDEAASFLQSLAEGKSWY